MTESYRTDDRVRGAQCFIQLCKLSEILGDVLPLEYDLKRDPDRLWKDIRRSETDMDAWETDLPVYLRYAEENRVPLVSGLSNLRLCYLAVRLLISRISLHVCRLFLPPSRHVAVILLINNRLLVWPTILTGRRANDITFQSCAGLLRI